ncbi:cathepsin L-like proteinase [Manduca sexta]|uniref:cathepsin L-like proteinase n=1 Tax=Manduca sexta TaxID=7130 RepID=UPI00188F653E|nr:cathepsin L-like proteinase [Manduca sexta]
MAYLPAVFILFLSAHRCLSYSLDNSDSLEDEGIRWPAEYHLKGEELNLKTGMKAPFEIWSSKSLNRYRRDYYDGVEKKYYYGVSGEENCTVYYMFPMSDEESINTIICVEQSNYDDDQEFLQHLPKGNYTGIAKFEDKEVQKWDFKEESDGQRMEVSAYTYKVEDEDVPVQITVKVYDLDKGRLESHTVTNYYGFSSEVDETDLDVEWGPAMCDDEETFWAKHHIGKLSPARKHHVDLAFRRFTTQHKKVYGEDEHEMRKSIFHENWKQVVEHNNKNLGYKLELNKYADWTDEEFAVLTGLRPSDRDFGAVPFPHTDKEVEAIVQDLPEEFDLRMEGVITPVKNQGSCGSCWAFCTVAAVEGALALRNGGRNLDLSEQALVDCAWGFDAQGCDGGAPNGGMKYVLEHGVPTEMEYGPYMAKNGFCEAYNMSKVFHINGFGQVTPRNANAMKVVLNKYGPAVVGVHAGTPMKFYSSGIFYDVTCEGRRQNHGVTLVGYGIRDGEMYWIVKNSWGEDWGEDGYILISANNNNCLLMDTAFYPIA